MQVSRILTIKEQYLPEMMLIFQSSLYLGIFLNIPTFLQKYYFVEGGGGSLFAADVFFSVSAAALLLSALAVFGRRVLLAGIIGFILLSVVASYYMWFFDVVIGYGVIQAVFGTELSLIVESMGFGLLAFVCLFGILPVYLLQRFSSKYVAPWATFLVPRLLCLALVVVGLTFLNIYYKTFREPMADARMPANPIGVATFSYVPINLVSAALISVANARVNSQLQGQLIDPTDRYGFYPEIPLDDLFVVVVIGESARYDHMSLMDYDIETTPLLDKEPNVVGLKGASCNTSTKLSLACMFVREGGVFERGSPSQQYVYENNVFSVLKKLGFSSDVFAMQSEAGFYARLDADRVKIREQIGAEASRKGIAVIDDMLLVEQMHRSILQKRGQHLVVLHQKGSHFNYASRYPVEFSKYKPDCKHLHCNSEAMINSYDNSIAYTDYFLFSLLEKLRDKKALLLYASDHGESLENGKHFHASPKETAPEEQFNIPVIMWASDTLLEDALFAQGYAALRRQAAKGTIVRQVEIFESLLGCMGIKSDRQGIRHRNNWCSVESTLAAVSSEGLIPGTILD
jgi:KDO II ethanolaminephosphotransferase